MIRGYELFWNCWLTGGACHECQLASRSHCQRDGCHRVHIWHGPDHWDYSASSATFPASVATVDHKPVLVERDNRRRTPFLRQHVTRPCQGSRESGEQMGSAER